MRAALYARVSHAGGDQDPEPQLAALRIYAAARGWAVVGEFVDRASAGHPTQRTAWRQIRGLVERRELEVVLVWKLDRAFRSALAALSGIDWLRRHKVEFCCATQPIDTSSSHGRLLLTMLAAVSECERDLISERTRQGLAAARARGAKLGRPLGAKDRRRRRRRRLATLALEDLAS